MSAVMVPPYVSVGCPRCEAGPGWACESEVVDRLVKEAELTVPIHEERKKAYEHAGPHGPAKFVQIAFDKEDGLTALDEAGDVWIYTYRENKRGWGRLETLRHEP